MKYTLDEWFVVALARTIRDQEVVFHGFGSPCAQVAMHVAKRTHARDMLIIEGAMYAVNPDPPFIPPTGNDHVLKHGATYSMKFEEFFDAATRGDVDRMFLSGGQIDQYGNTNVTAVGPLDKPKVKLGGGGGGCNISGTIGQLTLWTTRHRSGRTIVESCDFITDIGHRTPSGDRKQLGCIGRGPQWLISELGIFDYDDQGRMRLRELWPDVSVEMVREATGFEMPIAPSVQVVMPPTAEELAVVRNLDPLEVRKSEFDEREIARVFDLPDIPHE